MADAGEHAGGDVVMREDGGSRSTSEETDSSDESEFEEVQVSSGDAALLMQLEQQLADNPSLYDSHVRYIEALRRCKMGARLRDARDTFHAAFPLTEALWFEWLSDEMEGVGGEGDVARVEGLLEAAVADYLSIPLWVQYVEFVRDFDPQVQAGAPEGEAKMRALCERALTAAGLHVAEGSKLWSVYRGFEQACAEAQPSAEATERVRALWHRQLAVPLADGAQTLAEYEAWERAQPGGASWQLPATVKAAAERAGKAVALRAPYESSLSGRAADADLLAAYMAYVRMEEKQGDPARVQVVYERTVAAFPVTHYLWLQYCRYLESSLKIPAVINAAYSRALRNCPWVGMLWGRALRALERSGAPEDQHAALYDRALAAGLQSYEDYLEPVLARLDCLRRQGAAALPALRAAFRAATDLLHSYWPDHVDRAFRLTGYWADCEAGVGGNLAAARAVWEAALKGAAGQYAEAWAAYIDFERRRGHTREARTLYKRCYTRALEEGGQAVMCGAWLRFEREEGSAEDHLAASLKADPILADLQAAALTAADPGQHTTAKAAADKATQLSRDEVRAMRQQADPNFGKRKQQAQAQEGGKGGDMRPPPAKKPRTAASGANSVEVPAPAAAAAPAEGMQPAAGSEGGAPAAPAAQQQEQAAAPAQQEQGQQGQEPGEPAHGRPAWRQQRRTEANTAFVKHLADAVDEAALQQLFGSVPGGVKGVELGHDRNTGRSKGFAYVHFATDEGLQAACALDRTELHGKHIFVAPSRPPAGGPHQQQHGRGPDGRSGGRDGGRGGRDGGRFGGRDGGRGGRDGGRFGGGRDGGRGRGGRGGHRSMIDLGPDQPGAGGAAGGSALGFVPRAAALHSKQQDGSGSAAGGGEAAGGEAPKSNADFRAMFLKK